MKQILLIFALIVGAPAQIAAQGELKFAELGECPLQNGQVIRDCRVGYRTWGALNQGGSNAVLFPTWFTGSSHELSQFIGPEGFVDSSGFFVIAVDAFGNGESSSPSNSPRQPGSSFPHFTIRDMVDAQHRLLVEELGIDHLWAVIGISMGGMQAFEWLVAYPDFVEKAVPIVGSPQLSSYDLLLWETQLKVFEQCEAAGCEDPFVLMSLVLELAAYTPQYRNQQTSRGQVGALIERHSKGSASFVPPMDYASQLRAMLAHDVAASFGGDLNRAAATVRGDLLTVISTHDHTVTPETAREFTRLVGGVLLELDSYCGHIGFSCDAEIVGIATDGFFAEGR